MSSRSRSSSPPCRNTASRPSSVRWRMRWYERTGGGSSSSRQYRARDYRRRVSSTPPPTRIVLLPSPAAVERDGEDGAVAPGQWGGSDPALNMAGPMR
jgi:hypothetical protein